MTTVELHFCKLNILSPGIVEVIINEDVEVTGTMVRQLYKFLVNILHTPIYLLMNNINSYSYDFNAQRELGRLAEIRAMAMVSYTRVTHIAMYSLAFLPRDTDWVMEIFSNRDDALSWLMGVQQAEFGKAL